MIKFTEEEKIELKKTYEQCLIGRLSLSKYKEDYPPIVEKRQPVSKMKNSDCVVYFIEMLSLEPEVFEGKFNEYFSSELFVGLDICTNPKFLPKSYKHLSIKEKEKKLHEYLSNKLVVFRPKITFKGEYAYKNLEIVALIDDDKINKKSSFTPCPLTSDDNALCKGKEIYLPNNPHSEKFQSLIFSNHSIYLGRWVPVKNKENYWVAEVTKKRPIIKFGIDEILAYIFNTKKEDIEKFKKHKNIFVNIDNHTCFFYTPIIRAIDEYISYRGGTSKNMAIFSIQKEGNFNLKEHCLVSIQDNTDIKPKEEIEGVKVVEEVKEEVKVVEKIKEEIKKETKVEKINKIENNNEERKKIKNKKSEIKLETNYLNHLSNIVNSKQLLFDTNDILNVYTSMKTNNLTILSGMSGMGKMKLIRLFAQSLNISEEDNTLSIISVNNSFTEPSDLLGFYNAVNNKYIPTESNLLEVLLNAQNNKEQMHMVVFENMNLTQFEDWINPLLSLLKLNKEERILRLYNSNIDCLNANLYPSKITLGDNILFLGTISTDIENKEFSDRFLDNVNIIDISKKSFLGLKDMNRNKNTNLDAWICSNTFNKFKSKDENYLKVFSDKELVLFDNLDKLLQGCDPTKGISYALLLNIAEYISNIPKDSVGKSMLNESYILDLQIKDKILRKIKGTEKEYRELLGTCNSIDGEIKDSVLYNLFTSNIANEIGNFNETKKDIIRKSKELDLYGYTE